MPHLKTAGGQPLQDRATASTFRTSRPAQPTMQSVLTSQLVSPSPGFVHIALSNAAAHSCRAAAQEHLQAGSLPGLEERKRKEKTTPLMQWRCIWGTSV